MARRAAAAGVALSVGLLTACSSNGVGQNAKSAGVSTPATGGSSSSDRPDPHAIRAIDLSAQSYRVGVDERLITLVNGTHTDDLGRVSTLKGDPVYADVNDDGFDDVAVEIAILDGNGYEGLWYILLWDAAAGAVTQIIDPLARTARCGDVVTAVTAVDGAFRIDEQRISGAEKSCAHTPTQKKSRTVAVRDGWLVRTGPDHGYGGICPMVATSDVHKAPAATTMRTGPSADAPVITDTIAYVVELQDAYGMNGQRAQWELVGYITPDGHQDLYGPCGWMPVDFD